MDSNKSDKISIHADSQLANLHQKGKKCKKGRSSKTWSLIIIKLEANKQYYYAQNPE